jgi:Flp pilus assembly protein TadD
VGHLVQRASLEIRARLESGAELLKANRLDGAEAAFRAVIAMDPGNPDAHNLLGLLLKQRGDLAMALESLRRAIALDTNRPGFRSNLGGVPQSTGSPAGFCGGLGFARGRAVTIADGFLSSGHLHHLIELL